MDTHVLIAYFEKGMHGSQEFENQRRDIFDSFALFAQCWQYVHNKPRRGIDHLSESVDIMLVTEDHLLLFALAHHHSQHAEYPQASNSVLWVSSYHGAMKGQLFSSHSSILFDCLKCVCVDLGTKGQKKKRQAKFGVCANFNLDLFHFDCYHRPDQLSFF